MKNTPPAFTNELIVRKNSTTNNKTLTDELKIIPLEFRNQVIMENIPEVSKIKNKGPIKSKRLPPVIVKKRN